jgi:hypothetical protein
MRVCLSVHECEKEFEHCLSLAKDQQVDTPSIPVDKQQTTNQDDFTSNRVIIISFRSTRLFPHILFINGYLLIDF